MLRRRAVIVLVALAARTDLAGGEPTHVSVRVSGAVGVFEEITWEAPEIDLVGTFPVGSGFVEVAVGYAGIDNHTFLSDGRALRVAVAGGAEISGGFRAAATFAIEHVAFHADADVLSEHPDVDLIPRRGGVVPMTGVELSRRIGASSTIGLFVRIALRDLTVFDTTSGDRANARLVLGGAFLDLRLR